MASPTKREGEYTTFKLFEVEHDLLQNLGRGRPGIADRYTALEALAELVPDLDLEDVRGRNRHAIRVRIPPALKQAIDAKVKKTGQPFITVLLAAAAEYRRRHPLGNR